jgi:integrase
MGSGVAQSVERSRAGNPGPGLDLVFTTPRLSPLDPSNVNGRLHRLLEARGLEHRGMHALRHSYASALITQGIHPRVVMEQLGHSQISLTMDRYGHVMASSMRGAADALEAAFQGTGTEN